MSENWFTKKNMLPKNYFEKGFHEDNISVQYIPIIPHFYNSKIWVCRGIPIFLIFDPKHKLWVPVKTALAINVLSKNKKNLKNLYGKFSIVTTWEKSVY